MNEPINHHYLPVFYLRQWTNSDGKVVRYYRPYREAVASLITPERTGYERYLYTLAGYRPEQRQRIEREYMAPIVDEPASKVLRAMLEGNLPNPTEQERTDWARFLMSLDLRDPTTVAQNHRRALEIAVANLSSDPAEYEAIKGESDPATLLEFIQKHDPHYLENLGRLWLPGLIENQEVGNVIVNMQWSVMDLHESNLTLLTGDRPYIRDLGLKDPRCIIALPISPWLLFVATHAKQRQEAMLAEGSTRVVKKINNRIVRATIKHVYGYTDNHLLFVERRLAPAQVPQEM